MKGINELDVLYFYLVVIIGLKVFEVFSPIFHDVLPVPRFVVSHPETYIGICTGNKTIFFVVCILNCLHYKAGII